MRHLTGLLAATLLATAPAVAQDAAPTPGLTLELNALQPVEAGCRLTFVVENRLEGNVDKAGYELAFFDRDGFVTRLTAIEFLDLPAGRTRVRQFQFSGTSCEEIGHVLVNASTECSGDGISLAACLDGIETRNRTDIEFGS